MKQEKKSWQRFRIPLPKQRCEPHTGKKGKRGYKRQENKKILKQHLQDKEEI